jgi:hypothetical protein
MKKIFILIVISLFFVGTFLFLGSYVIFNRYSIRDSAFFPTGYPWQFPQIPLELHEGDQLEIKFSQTDSLDGNINSEFDWTEKSTFEQQSYQRNCLLSCSE